MIQRQPAGRSVKPPHTDPNIVAVAGAPGGPLSNGTTVCHVRVPRLARFPAILLAAALLTGACTPPPKAQPRGIEERYSGEAVADPAVRLQVMELTQAYWSAIRAGNWQGAYRFYTGDYKEKTPFREWLVLSHRDWAAPPEVTEIHWTKAAFRYHGPELYALVKWHARRASAGSEGVLVWRQQPAGGFLLENAEIRKPVRPKQ